VGVSHNVIEASWQALVDAIDFKLYQDGKRKPPRKSKSGKGKTRR
jgi:2-isopropylmalate synthase